MDSVGYEEYFYGKGVTVVEWADKIKDILPEKRIDVRFSHAGKTKRRIRIMEKGFHIHKNGFGIVEDTATVEESVFVGPDAKVSDNAKISENVRIFGKVKISGKFIHIVEGIKRAAELANQKKLNTSIDWM